MTTSSGCQAFASPEQKTPQSGVFCLRRIAKAANERSIFTGSGPVAAEQFSRYFVAGA